jgi:chorismate mutase
VCAAVVLSAVIVPAICAHADTSSPLRALVDAATQRLQTAEPVAASKWITGAPIDDQPRVQQVIAAVTADATAKHLDPQFVIRVFTDQIDATDAIEYTRFGQWKLDPAGAPAAAPDLSVSRAIIDGLNHAMISEMAAHWDTLHSPECFGLLDDARRDVTASRALDDLYQRALAFATRTYCQSTT